MLVEAVPILGPPTKGKDPLSPIATPRASKSRAPEPVSPRPDAQETLRLILARLDDMKAEDTIADRVLEGLKQAGVPGLRVEGLRNCDWVLIDAGDIIVHVFRPEVRAFYNLEKMWTSSPRSRRTS